MYELVLLHQGNEAVRVTEEPVSVGQTLLIDDSKWLVEAREPPRHPKATARYFCSRRAATSSNRNTTTQGLGVQPSQVVSGGRRERALETTRRADADVLLSCREGSR